MANWSDLPLELWHLIFKSLPRPSLIQCQITCGYWQRVVNKIMYTEISLSTGTQTTVLINTLVRSPSVPGYHLRKLELDNHHASLDIQAIIHQLAIHCPFIEMIFVAKPSDLFYQQIVQELNMNHLRYLNTLSYPETYGEAIESYTQAILRLRKRIRTVKLSDHVTPLFFRETYLPLMNNLADFVDVETLVFEKRKECKPSQIDLLIHALPSLKEIRLNLHQPLSFKYDRHAYRLLPRPNMRRLSINKLTGSDHAWMYIMMTFPNLEYLSIDQAHSDYLSTMAIKQKMAAYLGQLKGFRIRQMEKALSLSSGLNQYGALGSLRVKLYVDISPHAVQHSSDLNYQQRTGPRERQVHLSMCHTGRSSQLIAILKTYGGLVDELTLWCVGDEPGDQRDLDDVLELCPRLQEIHLKNYQITNEYAVEPTHSLRTLALVKCLYTSKALDTLSRRLPLLHQLDIIKSSSPDNSHPAYHIQCVMPQTSFQSLRYQWSCLRKLGDDIYLQLTTQNKPKQYYRISTTHLYPVRPQHYKRHVSSNKVLTIDLHCKELQCLMITDWQLSIHHTFAN
ncbi:hypothetical protein BD560DRAFT_416285 [Blakeslea trispora]|nr:hypothetical protein BD560DRAFT_416285 [Blakeslea trispora]